MKVRRKRAQKKPRTRACSTTLCAIPRTCSKSLRILAEQKTDTRGESSRAGYRAKQHPIRKMLRHLPKNGKHHCAEHLQMPDSNRALYYAA